MTAVTVRGRCPHCRAEVDIEAPRPGMFGADDEVEYQQDCRACGNTVVAVFGREPVLREVRAD